MISCTEFIPLYSEFFWFLEEKGGHDAVLEYWYYISDNGIGDRTNPNSLISFVEREKEGDAYYGAVKYWQHTLAEESSDVLKVHDLKNKCTYSHMRHCPSRGRLNAFEHIEPYYDYCGHCDIIYQRVLDRYGVRHEMDLSRIDNAECSSFLYDMKNGIDKEACMRIDDTKLVEDLKPEDNKYLHRDFHISGDLALRYCGEQFGDEAVIGFLESFTKKFYAPQIEDIKARGLVAIKEWIEKTYEVEEASDVLTTELTPDALIVTISKCPVVAYMRSLNQEPTRHYIEETRTVYRTAAEEAGFRFDMEYYTEDGGTRFTFCKK